MVWLWRKRLRFRQGLWSSFGVWSGSSVVGGGLRCCQRLDFNPGLAGRWGQSMDCRRLIQSGDSGWLVPMVVMVVMLMMVVFVRWSVLPFVAFWTDATTAAATPAPSSLIPHIFTCSFFCCCSCFIFVLPPFM